MKITMLGTGNAMVTECYNTCFLISSGGRNFLIDGGGGNTILRQLKYAGYECMDIDEIFITHKHIDHLLGVIWVVRAACQCMIQRHLVKEVNIYGHREVIALIRDMLDKLLLKKQLKLAEEHIHMITVNDGESRNILNRKVTFFDIQSTKEKQFGFCMELDDGEQLTCCGDEPYTPCIQKYAQNSKWLLHEAFCLDAQADVFDPYEKHHSTVMDACRIAESLHVENLILYHTEDKNLPHRKKLYAGEGSRFFHGNLYIPDDLEVISI